MKADYYKIANQQTMEILVKLVEGLEKQYWSSWQSTDKFWNELEEAQAYIDAHRYEVFK